jgi:DNA adenine methylase
MKAKPAAGLPLGAPVVHEIPGISGDHAPPRPFLKWAGGKGQLLSRFAPLYPDAGRAGLRRYAEPFLGSGAVLFHVQRLLRPASVLLADTNEDLIEVYRGVRDAPEAVIALLAAHRAAHARGHYYEVRALDPSRLDLAERAARFIYLNKTCYNGLYRQNSRGRFNVPMGRYVKPPILDADNLRAVSAALAGAELRVAHFRQTLDYARRGDFLYLDPPYDPLTATASFTSYTRRPFGAPDQEELADVYATLSRLGCRLMLSNSDTPLIRSLYRGFDIRGVLARRSINSRADRRGPVREVVVLNYRPAGEAG